MEFLSLIPATALGYLTFQATTHPNSAIHKKMPKIKKGRFQLFPSIKIHVKGRVIHFHHWVNFSILLTYSLVASAGILEYTLVRGLLIGGILQGLSMPKEYRRIIYPAHTS